METLNVVESAAQLRKALRAAFPGTKFSVRLNRGTAHGCADVSWTDGPHPEKVHEVTARFEGEGFDGMTDSNFRRETAIEVEGTTYRSGLRLISTHWRNSDAAIAAAEVVLRESGYVPTYGAARSLLYGLPVWSVVEHHHLKAVAQ